MTEAWRIVWRDGIAPQLPTSVLRELARGLATDNLAIVQGVTMRPAPLERLSHLPLIAGCPIVFGLWRAGFARTVGDAADLLGRILAEADERLQTRASCRQFWRFWDRTPRSKARAALLAEVSRGVRDRCACAA